jgi:hypothetical protein
MYQYALVHVAGETFNAETKKLGRIVTVGDWAELSLGMGAPNAAGTFSSYWRMMDFDGNLFGATLIVTIKVAAPTKTPQPTAQPSATPEPSDTPESSSSSSASP